MKTAAAARKGGTVKGRGVFGPLPDSRALSATFARAADYGKDVSDRGGGILDSIVGLVDVHRRVETLQPRWGDGVMTWDPRVGDMVLPTIDVDADPFLGVWEDAQRHILAIDLEARRILGEPPVGAVEHYEGLGTVFCRMAYLYTISFNRFVLDGPEGTNRKQLARAYASYENLAHDLVRGRKCLPSPTGGPGT